MNRRAFLTLPLLGAAALAAETKPRPLVIRPARTGKWEASPPDVQKVLDSAAGEIWKHFPEGELPPILVEPKGGPIVLFRRGPKGEYYVRLDTGKTYWCQYAFQFAHEFCHILCGYKESAKENKWFEESVCEMASLFALRAMARTWQTKPPYPNWQSFHKALHSYAADRIKNAQLPEGVPLVAWYRQNEPILRRNATMREKNNIVAVQLLPIFEKHPDHWPAVRWLNTRATEKPRTFRQYLLDWQQSAPEKHRGFIHDIARQFGVDLPKG